MTDFLVIYEPGPDGSWSARAADLPVYAVGDTLDDAEQEIRGAIALHLQALRERGQGPPERRSVLGSVSV